MKKLLNKFLQVDKPKFVHAPVANTSQTESVKLLNLQTELEIAKDAYAKIENKIKLHNNKLNLLLVIWTGILALLGYYISLVDISVLKYVMIAPAISICFAFIFTLIAFLPLEIHKLKPSLNNNNDIYKADRVEYLIYLIHYYDVYTEHLYKASVRRAKNLRWAHVFLSILIFVIFIEFILLFVGIIPLSV